MERENYKILIVDDQADILRLISYLLKGEGYSVSTCSDGKKAIELAQNSIPNLILLDITMPGMDGIETCQTLRELPALSGTLIAFLSARDEDYSQIAGFDAGGDDYIIKPVKPKVLISRVNALLRRLDRGSVNEHSAPSIIQRGELSIDREKYAVYLGKKELFLPKKEFELLLLLSSKPGRVYSREEIFDVVWEDNVIVGDRTIDVHIRKLREKIGDDLIITIKGVGYKFAE